MNLEALRALMESLPVIPWEADADTWILTHVGPQVVQLLGFPVEDWLQPDFWTDHVHPDDRDETVAGSRRGTELGADFELEYRMMSADGDVVWIRDFVGVEFADGVPVTIRGFMLDITEEKNLLNALRVSEERLRHVLQELPDALLLVGDDGVIIQTNRRATELFGYPEEELVDSSVDRLVPHRAEAGHAGHRDGFKRDPKRRSMGTGLDLTARRRDGSEVPVEISLSPIRREGNHLVLVSIRDLTDRKQIESDLRERDRLLLQMSNVLPALIAFVDEDRRYQYMNDTYASWLEVDPDEVVGRTVGEVLGEDLYATVRPGIDAVLAGETVRYEMEFPSRDGPGRPVKVSLDPRFRSDRTVEGYFVIIFDVSDRVEAEKADRLHRQELAHVSRVATMGELAASLAHELNQPLSAIVVNAQAARRFLAAPVPDLIEVDEALADISDDAKRAGDVILGMRKLLEKGEQVTEDVDLSLLVGETVAMLRSDAIARHVVVDVEFAEDLPRISGDPIQLKQVVMNLMVNAFEAISEAGRDSGLLTIEGSLEGEQIEISFTDNGPGLPDDIEEEVFAQFASSKPHGMGMGLSISRTIIEGHKGTLLAENLPGGGAILRITLPVTPSGLPVSPVGWMMRPGGTA